MRPRQGGIVRYSGRKVNKPCHPGRSASARRAGTQGPQRVRSPFWVPDISLSRNSGMTTARSIKVEKALALAGQEQVDPGVETRLHRPLGFVAQFFLRAHDGQGALANRLGAVDELQGAGAVGDVGLGDSRLDDAHHLAERDGYPSRDVV